MTECAMTRRAFSTSQAKILPKRAYIQDLMLYGNSSIDLDKEERKTF